ncbi:MAG: hypothetical protein IPL65_10610 [Lewinellaceae bacterium]|nr:hypothetical protein [Lewinellaceae bacterium]
MKYGLLGGLAVVMYFFLFYTIDKNLFLNPFVQWSSMVVYVLCMFQASKEDCAANSVHRDFRMITRTPFLVFILINLAYWLFYYSLHLADPELLQMETALQLKMLQEQLAAGTGDPDSANTLRENIQFLQKEGMTMTLGPVLMRMGMGAIGGFALAAAIAYLQRSKSPKTSA